MNTPRLILSKGVRRVTLLQPTEAVGRPPGVGDRMATVVYEYEGKKRKKQSRRLRVFERLARHLASGFAAYSETYLARHERSNEKKRDGWLRDFNYNTFRARKQAKKHVRLRKLFR